LPLKLQVHIENIPSLSTVSLKYTVQQHKMSLDEIICSQ